MKLVDNIRNNAKKKDKTIVLPEADDKRIIEAASIILKENIATPLLIGELNSVQDQADKCQIDLQDITIINPEEYSEFENFVDIYYKKRQHKGISKDDARECMLNRNFFGTMLV